MPDFYFQQFASREGKGYCWRDGMTQVPENWKETFFRTLQQSGLVPSDGRTLAADAGGIFLAEGNAFGAMFRFIAAPPDFRGRTGGVVTNVLFFDSVRSLRGKSLRNLWLHDSLRAGPGDPVPEKIFVCLGMDCGKTEAERRFFSLPDRSGEDAVIVPYSPEAFRPRSFPSPERKVAPMAETSRANNDKVPERSTDCFDWILTTGWKEMKSFLFGLVVGVILTAVTLWQFSSKKEKEVSPTPKETKIDICDFSLEQLKKEPQRITFEITLTEKKDKVDRVSVTMIRSEKPADSSNSCKAEPSASPKGNKTPKRDNEHESK